MIMMIFQLTVKTCKIFVKFPYHENFEYLLSNTFVNLIKQYF